METNAAVVSEFPMAEEEAKSEEIIAGGSSSSGASGKTKKTIIVALSVVPAADHQGQGAKVVSVTSSTKSVVPAADPHHGKVASVVSSVETEPFQETKKMKKNQNRVHVSNNKKPFIFYLNLARKYIYEINEVKLCGLGMAIPTVVTIAEILKRNGTAIQKEIMISTVLCTTTMEDKKGRPIEKAMIEIVLGKAEEVETTNLPKEAATSC